MNELLTIKKTLENQINVATEFLNEALANEVQEYIQHMKSKIEAWNEILEIINRKLS